MVTRSRLVVCFLAALTMTGCKTTSSSVVYRIGLFQGEGDEAAAEGRFVHVYVDNTSGPGTRPVRPLPDAIRAVALALVPKAPAD